MGLEVAPGEAVSAGEWMGGPGHDHTLPECQALCSKATLT